ncbi:MAG: hypothetical protein RMI49_04320 [Candidatus Caldarchaeum sp.]|nr:hypothetical protein [Candidatus Caldarchaeum sp.]
MEVELNQSIITSLIWFFIGFGAGLALLRFWKIIAITVAVAVLLPIIINLVGLVSPISSEQVVQALFQGINLFANILSANPYSALGFILGLVIGVIIFILRIRG